MTNVKLNSSKIDAATHGDAKPTRFIHDAARAARPWLMIVTVAAMIAITILFLVPALRTLEANGRATTEVGMVIGCYGIGILAGTYFIHLLLTSNKD